MGKSQSQFSEFQYKMSSKGGFTAKEKENRARIKNNSHSISDLDLQSKIGNKIHMDRD